MTGLQYGVRRVRADELPLFYNAIEVLEHNLAERPDKTALHSVKRSMSFAEVASEVNQVGNALRELEVRMGDTIALLSLDGVPWVTSFFATLKIGAISVGMNTLLTAREYDFILKDCRARILIVHESLYAKLEPILEGQPFLEHVVVIDSESPGATSYTAWIANKSTELEPARTHREDFCTLNYSSGTTGQPKGILHAHKDLALTAEHSGRQSLGISETDRTFAAAKLFFTFGTGGNLIFPWSVGASIVLFAGSPRVARDVVETIARFKPTIFFHTPTGYAMALASPGLLDEADLSSLRLCVSGGERLPPSVWEEWKARTGVTILDGIGATEVYHNFLCNPRDAVRPGSSGKPVPGYEARIVDEEGQDVDAGEVGNLLIRGESIALSYWHQYERSRSAFRGDWFFTGDKYSVDAEGYYWNAGRSDDMLKVGGIWVSPAEVEETLMAHDAVAECAVVGLGDSADLIKPVGFVVLREDVEAGEGFAEELIEYCRREMADYKRPRHIELVDELPKTATGKIQRYKLRNHQR